MAGFKLNFKPAPGQARRKEGTMLLKLDIDHAEQEIYAAIIDADVSGGIVLPCDYDDGDIVEFCNSELAAPSCGHYSDYTIIRED